ncbi:MAG: SAM-dependent methyltransferase [Buchnera aphidicola (Kaburagia rhusicola ensigallis)]
MSKTRSLSSKIWLKRHNKDRYVNLAWKYNIRSRSHFKLDQIHSVTQLFRKGMTVMDLGSSPGSWSEYAKKQIGRRGSIIACDVLPMLPIRGVFFIQGDIRDPKFFNFLLNHVKDKKIDLIMSDIAPNMSGFYCIDHCRSIELNQLVLKISTQLLFDNGKLVMKSFYGKQFRTLIEKIHVLFFKVQIFKPNASQTRSKEVYIIASGRRK